MLCRTVYLSCRKNKLLMGANILSLYMYQAYACMYNMSGRMGCIVLHETGSLKRTIRTNQSEAYILHAKRANIVSFYIVGLLFSV